MRILIDMNLSPDWVAVFQVAGIEAVHWSTIGQANAPDTVIFAYALQHKYVVFTHDLDFSAILAATNASAPSVIQVRTQDTMPASIGPAVFQALRQFDSSLQRGALVTIDMAKARVRVLPLRQP